MKHLQPRHADPARRPGPPRTCRGRLLPPPPHERDRPAAAVGAVPRNKRTIVFVAVVLAALAGYLGLCLGMNCCFPFHCGQPGWARK